MENGKWANNVHIADREGSGGQLFTRREILAFRGSAPQVSYHLTLWQNGGIVDLHIRIMTKCDVVDHHWCLSKWRHFWSSHGNRSKIAALLMIIVIVTKWRHFWSSLKFVLQRSRGCLHNCLLRRSGGWFSFVFIVIVVIISDNITPKSWFF